MFNRTVLKENALYYPSPEKVTEYLNKMDDLTHTYKKSYTSANIEVIRNEYTWEHLVDEHEKYFYWLMEQGNKW